jgi:hypothetical protein
MKLKATWYCKIIDAPKANIRQTIHGEKFLPVIQLK